MADKELRILSAASHPQRPSSETQFENKIAKVMRKQGIFSYHTNDRTYAGLPDRYVAGGRWIEFKQCYVRKSVAPCRFLSMVQRKVIPRLYEAGDRPFICMLFQFTMEPKRAILEPWETMKDEGFESWDLEKIAARGYIEDDWELMIEDKLG